MRVDGAQVGNGRQLLRRERARRQQQACRSSTMHRSSKGDRHENCICWGLLSCRGNVLPTPGSCTRVRSRQRRSQPEPRLCVQLVDWAAHPSDPLCPPCGRSMPCWIAARAGRHGRRPPPEPPPGRPPRSGRPAACPCRERRRLPAPRRVTPPQPGRPYTDITKPPIKVLATADILQTRCHEKTLSYTTESHAAI